jgi:hypothetical protein
MDIDLAGKVLSLLSGVVGLIAALISLKLSLAGASAKKGNAGVCGRTLDISADQNRKPEPTVNVVSAFLIALTFIGGGFIVDWTALQSLGSELDLQSFARSGIKELKNIGTVLLFQGVICWMLLQIGKNRNGLSLSSYTLGFIRAAFLVMPAYFLTKIAGVALDTWFMWDVKDLAVYVSKLTIDVQQEIASEGSCAVSYRSADCLQSVETAVLTIHLLQVGILIIGTTLVNVVLARLLRPVVGFSTVILFIANLAVSVVYLGTILLL